MPLHSFTLFYALLPHNNVNMQLTLSYHARSWTCNSQCCSAHTDAHVTKCSFTLFYHARPWTCNSHCRSAQTDTHVTMFLHTLLPKQECEPVATHNVIVPRLRLQGLWSPSWDEQHGSAFVWSVYTNDVRKSYVCVCIYMCVYVHVCMRVFMHACDEANTSDRCEKQQSRQNATGIPGLSKY
jgi:hypothetical protein